MSEPVTEAGKNLDSAWPGPHIDRLDWQNRILAIEAEAVARYKAALRERVEGLSRGPNPSRSRLLDPADILAAIDEVEG